MNENVKSKKPRTSFRSKIDSIITILLVILALYCVFGVYHQRKTGDMFFFLGYRPVIIMSGSMEPALETGSIAFVKKTKTIQNLEIQSLILS